MDALRKRAYLNLLYLGLVHIRSLCGAGDPMSDFCEDNPGLGMEDRLIVLSIRRKTRDASILADWLHNLALYAKSDFVAFDEDQFWLHYERCRAQFPYCAISGMRADFEDALDIQR